MGTSQLRTLAGGLHQAGGLRRNSVDGYHLHAVVLQPLGLGGDVGLDHVILLHGRDFHVATLYSLPQTLLSILAHLVALEKDSELLAIVVLGNVLAEHGALGHVVGITGEAGPCHRVGPFG